MEHSKNTGALWTSTSQYCARYSSTKNLLLSIFINFSDITCKLDLIRMATFGGIWRKKRKQYDHLILLNKLRTTNTQNIKMLLNKNDIRHNTEGQSNRILFFEDSCRKSTWDWQGLGLVRKHYNMHRSYQSSAYSTLKFTSIMFMPS